MNNYIKWLTSDWGDPRISDSQAVLIFISILNIIILFFVSSIAFITNTINMFYFRYLLVTVVLLLVLYLLREDNNDN
jgi:hypothetical protein